MTKSATRSFADELGIDDNATSTAVTIDASENVLVGKTSTDLAIAGYRIDPRGFTQNTRSDGSVAYYNRLTSDGEIINFSKDGTTVGSIISDSGSIMLGSGDVGVYFDAASDRILPMNITTGSVRNDAIDIGGNPHRFKDLYLSGGVVFGPASASNVSSQTLDDYEEGTWTVTDQSGAGMSLTIYVAMYTKIGNKVFFEIGMEFPTTSSTADIRLSLPFTSKSGADNTGGATLVGTNSGRNDLWLVSRGNAFFHPNNNLNSSSVSSHPTNASYSNKQLKLQGAYTVA